MISIAHGVAVAAPVAPADRLRSVRLGFGWLCLGGGCLVALYWLLYFTGAVALGQEQPLVASFESAFPLADTVLAAVLIGAGITLLKDREAAPFLLTTGGAMSTYLGLLDLTFYARLGGVGGIGTALTAALNALSLLGGLAALAVAWRLRRAA